MYEVGEEVWYQSLYSPEWHSATVIDVYKEWIHLDIGHRQVLASHGQVKHK